jgi:hypothetical protein
MAGGSRQGCHELASLVIVMVQLSCAGGRGGECAVVVQDTPPYHGVLSGNKRRTLYPKPFASFP